MNNFLESLAAYEKILQAEARAAQDWVDENVMSARTAGYLLLEPHAWHRTPSDRPPAKVTDEIITLSQDTRYDEHDAVFVVSQR